jgi:prevent-host-death family protein
MGMPLGDRERPPSLCSSHVRSQEASMTCAPGTRECYPDAEWHGLGHLPRPLTASGLDAAVAWSYDLIEMYKSDNEHGTGHVSVSEARESFADLVNRAAYRQERILIARRGKPIAAIVPMEDVEALERFEDEMDLQLARAALAEPENAVTYSLDEVEAEHSRTQ